MRNIIVIMAQTQNNTDFIDMFNRKLGEFIDDLIECYNDLEDLKVFKSMLDLAIYMDKNVPQQMFHETVTKKYEKYIVEYNEAFFLEEEYDPTYTDINLVNKLKGIWKTMETHNKNIIWKYLHVLLVLDRKCNC